MRKIMKVCMLAFLSAASGCAGIDGPDWCHPGWIDQQRNRAQRFDPYPLPDLGPEVVGGRPREFQVPAPETQRVQNQRSYTRRFGQLAPRARY